MTSSSHQHVVLLVDDCPDLRDALARLLDARGYRVRAAASGAAALTLLAGGERPCVMLLDEHMPGLSGHDVQARVRRMPALRTLPVVLMTGDVASTGHGAAAVLTKPIDAPYLFDAVEAYANCPAASPPAAAERVRRGPRHAAALHRHIEATLDELRARLDAARKLRDEQMRLAVRWGFDAPSPKRHGNG